MIRPARERDVAVSRPRMLLALALTTAVAACGPHADAGLRTTGDLNVHESARAEALPERSRQSPWSVAAPGPISGDLMTPDILVIGKATLPSAVRQRVGDLPAVRLAEPISIASVPVADRSITVAAVEPGTYRRFTPEQTATMDAVWHAVSSGDALLSHQIGADLRQPLGGNLALRSRSTELALRIGAYATTVPQVDAVVNERRGEQLRITRHNGLLISISDMPADAASDAVRRAVGGDADVQLLSAVSATAGTRQAAALTGSAVSQQLGSFSYQYLPDGTVRPDPRWVAANIRTEQVPILGRVTCHRLMLPQLRAALAEIVQRGLSSAIDPGDYGGCYVPRFIGHDPNRGLSLHTWGIAIDVNVQTNQRGTVGEIDRDVVAIFKRWGFAWGGDWEWTDPMHFELAALVRE